MTNRNFLFNGRRPGLVARSALALLFASHAGAIDVSPDITIDVAGQIVDDHQIAVEESGMSLAVVDLGVLPPHAEVDAYHLGSDGTDYFSLDIPASLPGGVEAQPADLVRWDGAAYAIEFDASAYGLGASVDLDAATRNGALWLFSFDTSVQIGAAVFHDDDVVGFDGLDFTTQIDATTVGIPAGLDLDALHAFPNEDAIGLSFDGSGRIAGVDFSDEDVLLLGSASRPAAATWHLYWDGSAASPGWTAADVDAVNFVPEPAFGLGLALTFASLLRVARSRRRGAAAGIAAALCVFVGAPIAHAGDGVVEINQACAEHTGCFAGDAPGFPITITGAAGSNYRFTSDVDVQGILAGIQVTQEGVTLDLNGFALQSITTCTGDPGALTCVPIGLFHGIEGPAKTTILNGRVSNFPGYGIYIESGRIEEIVSTENAGGGIRVETSAPGKKHASTVSGSMVLRNGGFGLRAQRSHVSDCHLIGNNNMGVDLLGGGAISGSEVSENSGYGIVATAGIDTPALITDNRVTGNANIGIWAYIAARIHGNVVTGNGDHGIDVGAASHVDANVVYQNDGHGVRAGQDALVSNNTIRNNLDFELYFAGTRSAFRDNVISSSGTSTVGFSVTASALNQGGNTCNGSPVCP